MRRTFQRSARCGKLASGNWLSKKKSRDLRLIARRIFKKVIGIEGKDITCASTTTSRHKLRAIRWCEARGLRTVEQKKEYCRKLSKRLLKPMREPGEDEEEKAA
jgi:hypothetical protein